MCLSTVYRDSVDSNSIYMKNVMRIQCANGVVTLTDLMGRKMEIEGEIADANLVEGIVIIHARA